MNIVDEAKNRYILQKEYLGVEKPVNKIEPLVSVVVATYQHVAFIRDCLEGILMQKVNFSIEIIVGEDESTDGTRAICIDYAEKYPDRIRLFLRDRRLSQLYNEKGELVKILNSNWNRMAARGKYMAWCEGDDYWIDPYKLQKQVNFLETNPDFIIHHHNVMNVDSQGNNIKPFLDLNRMIKSESDLSDYLLGGNAGITCSMVFRWNNKINHDLAELNYVDDNVLYAYLLNLGFKAKYSDELMACYRIHPGGIWSLCDEKNRMIQSVATYTGILQACRKQRFIYNQVFILVRLYLKLSTFSNYAQEKNKYMLLALRSLFTINYLHFKDIVSLKYYKILFKAIFLIFTSFFGVKY
jgi:glycosyltransferase involved in cell wall biosynthesis